MPHRSQVIRLLALSAVTACAVALTGCDTSTGGATDYRVRYPIAAQEKVFTLMVPVPPSGGAITAAHRHRIKRFAAEYLRRGRGPILVAVATTATASEKYRSMIAQALGEAGVPRPTIYFQARPAKTAPRRTAELSFSGYIVRLPECGDWSGHAGFDPNNLPHTDFGCSFQRNVGLILSNPGDLSVTGDPVEADTPNSDRVVRTFRDGKALGRQAPVLEQKEFSDVK